MSSKQESKQEKLNPITAEGVGAVMAAAKEDADALKFTYTSKSELAEGFVSKVTLPEGHEMVVDEPTTMPGGQNKGANPLDVMCASFGTCQEITYKMYATAMGIDLKSVSADIKGDINLNGLVGNGGPVAFTKITGLITVVSNASEEDLQKLKAASDAHCPLLATLQNEIPITLELKHKKGGRSLEEITEQDPVKKEGLAAVIAAGKEDNKALAFQYGSTSILDTNTLKTDVTMLGGQKMTVDEPKTMPGGNNQGPNPLDVFCASLGTCQEITWKMFGQVSGVPISKVSCEVKAPIDLRGLLGLDDAVAFDKISAVVEVESQASTETIEGLKKAVDSHCPMVSTIQNKIDVNLKLKIVKPSCDSK